MLNKEGREGTGAGGVIGAGGSPSAWGAAVLRVLPVLVLKEVAVVEVLARLEAPLGAREVRALEHPSSFDFWFAPYWDSEVVVLRWLSTFPC